MAPLATLLPATDLFAVTTTQVLEDCKLCLVILILKLSTIISRSAMDEEYLTSHRNTLSPRTNIPAFIFLLAPHYRASSRKH